MTLPHGHFAHLPAEIVVNIAGWLPAKNDFTAGEPQTHISRDRGNLSLVNRRTREIMVTTLLYRIYDLCFSSIEHLQELSHHTSWCQAIEVITIRTSVRPNARLLRGQSVHVYDESLASLLSRTTKVQKVMWKYRTDEEARESYPGCLLTETVRALTGLSTIRHIAADNIATNADFQQSLKSIYVASDLSDGDYEGLDFQSYMHIWDIIATYPSLDTAFVALLPEPLSYSEQTLRNAHLQCRPLNVRELLLERVYHARTDAEENNLVARILDQCPRIGRLSLDIHDLAWMPHKVDRAQSVRLPELRTLVLTVALLTSEDPAFGPAIMEDVRRCDIITASPITELEVLQGAMIRFLLDLLQSHARILPHITQLVLAGEAASIPTYTQSYNSEMHATATACPQRKYDILVVHSTNFDGWTGTFCRCCA